MSVQAHEPHLLTVKQTARALNVSEPTVRRMISAGQLASVRIGAGSVAPAVRVRPADLREWLGDGPEAA